ncbi:MAG TPA: hypothetical protein DIV40_09980 [Clostridiales bacterium]|jgi:hypothetical protein|nr:hypothetical protein [Clostridiales bacterium]
MITCIPIVSFTKNTGSGIMKRIISAILIGLMLITTLAGCGVNELGYLNLSKEISSLTQYGFNNTTSVVLSKEFVDEEYKIDFEIDGEVNMDDLNDLYGEMKFTFEINDIEIETPINIKFSDNKVYISKNAVIEMIKYEKMLNGTEEYGKIVEELYNNDLKDIDYIVINSQAFMYGFNQGLSGGFQEIPQDEDAYAKRYDYTYDYITKAFKGFDTKLIKKINNGYSFELTPESALEFAKSLVTYLNENREVVFDETINYLEKIYSLIVEEEFTVEEKAAAIAEIKESRQEFYDFIDEAVLFMESEELEQGTSMFDDSIIKMEMYKQNDSYKQVIDSEIVYENVSMGKLSSITILTPKNVEKVPVTGNTITLEEMEKAYTKAENKVNPVQKVEIQWYADSISTEVIKYRLNGNYDFDFQPYTIIEGRIYLPLRYISESFGEEVDWDNVNKKAYVVRSEEKVDMTGVLVDSRTMIKIRDFEKLGYKIDYVNVDGKSIAIIIK